MTILTAKLKEEKAKTELSNKNKPQQYNAELVNLVFDKEIDYQIVQRVMHDSALAGYSQFKFIVKGNY
jgi:biopolymer transport protein ExbD